MIMPRWSTLAETIAYGSIAQNRAFNDQTALIIVLTGISLPILKRQQRARASEREKKYRNTVDKNITIFFSLFRSLSASHSLKSRNEWREWCVKCDRWLLSLSFFFFFSFSLSLHRSHFKWRLELIRKKKTCYYRSVIDSCRNML